MLGQADQPHLADGRAGGLLEDPISVAIVFAEQLADLAAGFILPDHADDATSAPSTDRSAATFPAPPTALRS